MAAVMKDYARLKYITETTESVTVEVPLPIEKLIHEEVCRVIKLTAKDYARLFGSKDQLTQQANEKLDNITSILAMWHMMKL
ncbi:hypothetical protein LSH36_1g05103 [Paralvinella palmiformis]|uniref:Uncharacterized protein n=1 Tax=Paralvinella palmiformis TaxID=53620 RepID=A0AAD9KFE5_9ANNE|nr:hypothetical protein LSH36_1g05103 [Paralvinella palmiformis]